MLNLQEQTPTDVQVRESQPEVRPRRRRGLIILGLVVLAVVLLVLRGLFFHHPSGNGMRPGGFGGTQFNQPVAVSIAKVTTGDIPISIEALGTITPLATVTVKTQIAGQLTKIAFKEGQMVKKGDFLAQIDPRPYQAAVDQAAGTLRRDQALLADARLDLKRYQDLLKQDGIPEQQVDTQRALVEQYIGTVETDQASLEAARVNLAYTHIVSPVTGRVGLRQVDQGNYVTPADTNGIVVVTQLQPITAIFPIPEDNVNEVMSRLYHGAVLPVLAYDHTNTVKLAAGHLETLDNEIDTTTGTVKLRAIFDNKDGALFPNQFVNMHLIVDTLHHQILMPTAALRRGAPNGVVSEFVYLVNTKASTVAVRPVTIGVQDGELTAVTSGLAVGDVVVTEGGDRLREGAKVVLPGAPPPDLSKWTGRRHGGFRRSRF